MATHVINLKIGQALQIGGDVCIGLNERKGAQVKLIIATTLSPVIQLLPTGIFPERFSAPGITGQRHYAGGRPVASQIPELALVG